MESSIKKDHITDQINGREILLCFFIQPSETLLEDFESLNLLLFSAKNHKKRLI